MTRAAVDPGDPTRLRETWQSFARAVGKDAVARGNPQTRRDGGELIVMGAGLGGSDLLPDVRQALARADVVFLCLADAVTQVMIQRIRPDAIDLSIFYDATKVRYATYIQMAEAMLFPAREGQKVLALYYGHPGIFAMPTHRALAIARSQGISAAMRPGISALDYMVADVGFDPAYPGLLSYEATDMLLRTRRLDPSLHVVIWQIGVFGELGHNRRGFAVDNFPRLIDFIQQTYGDVEVVHYIGSRFPGVPPLIERVRLPQLLDAKVRRTISAISTLYIPPVAPGTNDMHAAALMKVPHLNAAPNGVPPIFNVARYGSHEAAALEALGDFAVPDDYRFVTSTPGIEFVIDLHDDPDLREEFAADPDAALDRPKYADLSAHARSLLRDRSIRSVNAALRERGGADE